ncbi:MAG: 2OG-Fe(II) oxygenase [Roseivirga sp.]|nr:2OG-Fe(II) oxygenase [Roseivirga sp.]
MIELKRDKTIVHSEKVLNELKREFIQEHCVVLDHLLTPDLSLLSERQLSKASFQETTHYAPSGSTFGKEETMSGKSDFLTPALSLMINRDTFINTIRHITGKPEIQSFNGRIYQLNESKNGFLTWHDDSNVKDRIIGFSLNLSRSVYEGGHFLIRDKNTKKVYKEISYKEWGSAHIFRIDKNLEHMVTRVTGEHPRITLAGWFYPTKGIKEFLSI